MPRSSFTTNETPSQRYSFQSTDFTKLHQMAPEVRSGYVFIVWIAVRISRVLGWLVNIWVFKSYQHMIGFFHLWGNWNERKYLGKADYYFEWSLHVILWLRLRVAYTVLVVCRYIIYQPPGTVYSNIRWHTNALYFSMQPWRLSV